MTVAFEFEEKKEEEENPGKVKVSSLGFILAFTYYGQGPVYRSGVELFWCSERPRNTRRHVSRVARLFPGGTRGAFCCCCPDGAAVATWVRAGPPPAVGFLL